MGIKDLFRTAAKATHPDHGGDAEAFKAVKELYDAACRAEALGRTSAFTEEEHAGFARSQQHCNEREARQAHNAQWHAQNAKDQRAWEFEQQKARAKDADAKARRKKNDRVCRQQVRSKLQPDWPNPERCEQHSDDGLGCESSSIGGQSWSEWDAAHGYHTSDGTEY